MANQLVLFAANLLLLLLLICCTLLAFASNQQSSQQTQYQIEVKQSNNGNKGCPSSSVAAANLNLLCSPDDGTKWSWNSTALLDHGNILKIYESTLINQHQPSKKVMTTLLPPSHHATTCDLVWVDASKTNVSQISHKIKGGYEENGEEQFICRSRDPADVNSFTGKLTTRQGLCVISWLPDRAYNAHYQVLTNPKNVSLRWVADRKGHLPPKAWLAAEVKVQTEPSNYYVGRVKVGKSLQVGKIKQEGARVIFYVNNRQYTNYAKVKSAGKSPWYYKKLDNAEYQQYSENYEALVVC